MLCPTNGDPHARARGSALKALQRCRGRRWTVLSAVGARALRRSAAGSFCDSLQYLGGKTFNHFPCSGTQNRRDRHLRPLSSLTLGVGVAFNHTGW